MRALSAVACTALFAAYAVACPQTTLVVGFEPGGPADVVARHFVHRLEGKLPKIHIEHRSGATGLVAANHVKASAPDGCTLYVMSSGSTMKVPPEESGIGLAAVAQIVLFDYALVVRSDGPMSLESYLARAKENDEWRNFAPGGSESVPHLIVEGLARASGVPLVHVPTRGSAPAIQHLLAGQGVYMVATVVGAVQEYVRDNRMHVLATTGEKRSRAFPERPTLQELGYGHVSVGGWMGVFAPPSTPQDVISRLNRLFASVPLANALYDAGFDPANSTPEELAALHRRDYERLAPVLAMLRVKK